MSLNSIEEAENALILKTNTPEEPTNDIRSNQATAALVPGPGVPLYSLSNAQVNAFYAQARNSMSQVGVAIRYERYNQNLTQQALADMAGTSKSTVGRIENGHTTSYWALLKVMTALGKQLTIQ